MAINHSAVMDVDAAQSPMGDVSQSVEQLNSLLRGEIAAAETYRMAIDKFSQSSHSSDVGLLQGIQEEHSRAAQTIRDRIRELDGEASDASGAWGVWAKLVQGLADMVGDTSSLKALKEGEEHGLKDYQAALDRVDSTSRQLMQNQCIPSQERHIGVLDQLISLSTSAS
jgi:bacterioferritin (cytochrome b1)